MPRNLPDQIHGAECRGDEGTRFGHADAEGADNQRVYELVSLTSLC